MDKLEDFLDEQKSKNMLCHIIRKLFDVGPHTLRVTPEEWEKVTEKMYLEWTALNEINLDDKVYSGMKLVAKKLKMDPWELLLRTKMMYFIAKSEVLKMEVDDGKGN